MTGRWMGVAVGLFLLAGCSGDDHSAGSEGEALYSDNCAKCHKESGKGNFIEGIPANVDTSLNKQQIVTLVTQGLPTHPQMPVIGNLSPEQAGLIADYLLQMAAAR